MSVHESRRESRLREKIAEARSTYLEDMSGVDLTKPGAIVTVAQIQVRQETLEEVIFMLDEINEELLRS